MYVKTKAGFMPKDREGYFTILVYMQNMWGKGYMEMINNYYATMMDKMVAV